MAVALRKQPTHRAAAGLQAALRDLPALGPDPLPQWLAKGDHDPACFAALALSIGSLPCPFPPRTASIAWHNSLTGSWQSAAASACQQCSQQPVAACYALLVMQPGQAKRRRGSMPAWQLGMAAHRQRHVASAAAQQHPIKQHKAGSETHRS